MSRIKMEKISREELLKKASLSLEDLEKVTGGDAFDDCLHSMENKFDSCIAQCGDEDCPYECEKAFADNLNGCLPFA